MFVSFAVLKETGAKGSSYFQFFKKISIGHTLSNAMTTQHKCIIRSNLSRYPDFSGSIRSIGSIGSFVNQQN
jgi:hypothetical protein